VTVAIVLLVCDVPQPFCIKAPNSSMQGPVSCTLVPWVLNEIACGREDASQLTPTEVLDAAAIVVWERAHKSDTENLLSLVRAAKPSVLFECPRLDQGVNLFNVTPAHVLAMLCNPNYGVVSLGNDMVTPECILQAVAIDLQRMLIRLDAHASVIMGPNWSVKQRSWLRGLLGESTNVGHWSTSLWDTLEQLVPQDVVLWTGVMMGVNNIDSVRLGSGRVSIHPFGSSAGACGEDNQGYSGSMIVTNTYIGLRYNRAHVPLHAEIAKPILLGHALLSLVLKLAEKRRDCILFHWVYGAQESHSPVQMQLLTQLFAFCNDSRVWAYQDPVKLRRSIGKVLSTYTAQRFDTSQVAPLKEAIRKWCEISASPSTDPEGSSLEISAMDYFSHGPHHRITSKQFQTEAGAFCSQVLIILDACKDLTELHRLTRRMEVEGIFRMDGAVCSIPFR
jgi:hypothetical protein